MSDSAVLEFIQNGTGSGHFGSMLALNNFDPRPFRPWRGEDGQTYVNRLTSNGKIEVVRVANTPGLLRREDWVELDKAIVQQAVQRLKLVQDIRGAGLNYSIPNGMGKTMLETEVMSDTMEASISMDGLRKGPADRAEFDIKHLPLPLVHKDFFISARQLAASRNGGSPFDTTMGGQAGRRVAELVEKLTSGTYGTFTYGGGQVQGLTNFVDRNTQVITAPDITAWTPDTTVNDVLNMRDKLRLDNMFGPYGLYHSADWDIYMDKDYRDVSSVLSLTLRERLAKLAGISWIKSLDYLGTQGSFNLVLVQMTSDVIRMVLGQDFTTIQWESSGGMQINFKVFCILVPQLRSDFAGQCGVCHGAPS